jgi:hypothetical protein
MIQRIQTIYLAVAAALSGLLLNGPIVSLIGDGGELYHLYWKGIMLESSRGSLSLTERTLPLSIIMIIVPLLFIGSVFLYKRRKLQIRATVLATLLMAGAMILMAYYIWFAGNQLNADYFFNFKLTLPPAGVIMGYLAFRGILKDELLIRSYDRFRK